MTHTRAWALALLMACAPAKTDTRNQLDPQPVLDAYAANMYAAYSDSVTDAQALKTAVGAFLDDPNETTLTAARRAWIAARAHYMLVEGARFVNGPIDINPPNHEAALNSWPLDEAYIDYTTDSDGNTNETTGFINNPALMPAITIDAVDSANAKGGDTNIASGYHAVEFLLWGQALVNVGPGTRPASDYQKTGRKNADRRAQYLRVTTDGIIQHLLAVRDAWAPGADYRRAFTKGGMDSIALILTSLGKMSKGELASQRLNAPYASKSRRDQHDCFSSETLTDYERNARGIQAMYLGSYGSNTTGPGVSSLVKQVDADLDTKLQAQLQHSVDKMVAIAKPFEAAIVGTDTDPGRVAIRATVISLRAQGDQFAAAATALGLTIQAHDED